MSEQIQRDLGRHDARLDSMEKDLQDVREQLEKICERLDVINQTLTTAAGGWKTLMLVGGMIAAVFHFLGFLFDKAAVLLKP